MFGPCRHEYISLSGRYLFGKAGFGSFGLRKSRYPLQSLGSYLTCGFYAAIGFRWPILPKLQKGKASANIRRLRERDGYALGIVAEILLWGTNKRLQQKPGPLRSLGNAQNSKTINPSDKPYSSKNLNSGFSA